MTATPELQPPPTEMQTTPTKAHNPVNSVLIEKNLKPQNNSRDEDEDADETEEEKEECAAETRMEQCDGKQLPKVADPANPKITKLTARNEITSDRERPYTQTKSYYNNFLESTQQKWMKHKKLHTSRTHNNKLQNQYQKSIHTH